jgi:type VI secretion system protein ImpG
VLPARLRLFVDGEASTRAALIDALFLRGACAFVQAGGEAAWLPLPPCRWRPPASRKRMR